MEQSVQTENYQDPLEGAFEKRLPWTFTFTDTDNHASVHITADDWSGRQFALPVGAILEMADRLRPRPASSRRRSSKPADTSP